MILKSLLLENIRSHQKTELKFDRGITVFTGRTGSGKSTILMAIEYVLFGSASGISNQMILRRGAKAGRIVLEFEHNGSTYKVERGLKRTGKSILVDEHHLRLFKDGVKLPVMARAKDLNEEVLGILGYPSDCNPRDVFEVTSYTKQDEVRKLIELRPAERQQFIDRILQLSKYKNTSDNMRDLISRLREEVKRIEGSVEVELKLKEEVEDLHREKIKIEGDIQRRKKELGEVDTKVNELRKKIDEIKRASDRILKSKEEYDSVNGRLIRVEKEISKLEEEIKIFEKEVVNSKLEVQKLKIDRKIEEVWEEKDKLLKEIGALEGEKKRLRQELKNVEELKTDICPLCKQKISEEHKKKLMEEYSRRMEEIDHKLAELLKKKTELGEAEKQIRAKTELEEKVLEYERSLTEKKKRLKELKEEVDILNSRKKELEKEVSEFEKVRRTLWELQEAEKEAFAKRESIIREIELLNSRVKDLVERIKEKKIELEEIEKLKGKLSKLKDLVDLLGRLRDDIKNIREVVRNKFLDDLRMEFQKFFEEIRREGEYIVNIDQNYEPIAYTKSGEEVPISNLSGGERTSVALSYRLALANIAAQISGIQKSELLILDEPTVGFDKEDIRTLPEVLRKLKTIPQIIIVTHEDELKDAGDYKFEIEKVNGVSRVRKVE